MLSTKKAVFVVVLTVLLVAELRLVSKAATGQDSRTKHEDEVLTRPNRVSTRSSQPKRATYSTLATPDEDDDNTHETDSDFIGSSTRQADDIVSGGGLNVRAPQKTGAGTRKRPNRLRSAPDTISLTSSNTSIASLLNSRNHEHDWVSKPRFQSRIRRYPESPFLKGYKPTGGALPHDAAEYLFDPNMWRFVDNRTCLAPSNSPTPRSESESTSTSSVPPWQKRAPFAILIGVMKGGTHALMASLWEHPMIKRTNHWELHFFDNGNLAIRTDKGIQQQKSRENYAKSFLKAIPDFPTNDSAKIIAIDSSPRYILSSDRIPDLITCVAPWAKLLAIVRDPVERVSSQYRYLDETRRRFEKPMVDWETWIQDDIRLLREAGVLQAQTQREEYLAWKKYQRRPNSNQIVGRGLYVIQIEQYFDALDRVGKPRSDLLILQSEEFRRDRQGQYNKVLDFLDLPPHKLVNLTDEHPTNRQSTSQMPDSIRAELQSLYRPYNERLYRLLNWAKVWD